MSEPAEQAPLQQILYRRVVSLTHPLHPGIPLWPGDPPLRFETAATPAQDGYFLRRFSMGEHSGTHASAPIAFDPHGDGVDLYPPEALVAPAAVVDVRAEAAAHPDLAVGPELLQAWEESHGAFPTGSLVLLCTGWDRYWRDPAAFLNLDREGTPHFPGFAAAAVRWLLEDRSIAGVGIDTHGVDPGADRTYAASRQVLARGGLVLENLARLDELPPRGATVVVGLLPLVGGSGAPAAVLALVP